MFYTLCAVLVILLSMAGGSTADCQLCPKNTKVYPMTVDCGASKQTMYNKLKNYYHFFTDAMGITAATFFGLPMLAWSSLFGRKRNSHIEPINVCVNIYNYPNQVDVSRNGSTFTIISYKGRCALVPRESMFCIGQCCNALTPIGTNSPNQAVTSTLATTQAPVMLTDVHICDKNSAVTTLAHAQSITMNGLMCRDNKHALSESIPIKFCNATSSAFWTRGHKVVDVCNSLPVFTAIGSFSNSAYSHDGLAGILIGCSDKEVRIATQNCTSEFSVRHIFKRNGVNNNQNAEQYYTINW